MSLIGVLDSSGPHPEAKWASTKRLWKNTVPSTQRTVLRGVYWVPKPERPPMWLREFTITNSLEPRKAFSVLVETPRAYGLPRFWGLSRFGPPMFDQRTSGTKLPQEWFEFCPHRPLRDYQNAAITQVRRSLDSLGGAVIQADCALGKTAIALALCSIYRVRTLFIAHRGVLLEQAIAAAGGCFVKNMKTTRALHRLLPFLDAEMTEKLGSALRTNVRQPWLPNCRAGFARGKTIEDVRPTDNFVVGSLASLAQFTYPQSFYDSFGMVIVDESHHIGGPTFSQVLARFPARFIVGLTATPKRSDGTEYLLYWLMGPIAVKYQRNYSMPPLVSSAPTKVHVALIPSPFTSPFVALGPNPKMQFIHCLKVLGANSDRNAMIASLVQALSECRRCIIVIFCLKKQLWAVHSMLTLRCPRLAVGVMTQEVSSVGPETNPPKVILGIDERCCEGWDYPPIDTVVFGSVPRGRIKLQQSVGRGERSAPGKNDIIVVDIWDSNNHMLQRRNLDRREFYLERRYNITPTSADIYCARLRSPTCGSPCGTS